MNILPYHQGRLEDYSLTNTSSRTGVMCSLRRNSRHHTIGHSRHRLKFLKINFGHSSQRRVAVVKPTVKISLHKRMESS